MEFLVITLCLVAERFFAKKNTHHRFNWFMTYSDNVSILIARFPAWFVLMAIILPVLVLSSLVFYLFGNVLFGLVGFILNLFVFYYCLGPSNPFSSVKDDFDSMLTKEQTGDYLAAANEQLFAVIVWYVLLGPISIIAYRLFSLCQGLPDGSPIARNLVDIFDFLPARLTALLYLLVGDFQRGFELFCKGFISSPRNNQVLLRRCGLAAFGVTDTSTQTMRSVERLIEHATIILLVFLAIVTMASYTV